MTQYQQQVIHIGKQLADLALFFKGRSLDAAAQLDVLKVISLAATGLIDATEADLNRAGESLNAPQAPVSQPPVPTIGRVVRFVLPSTELRAGNVRAAMIVGVPCEYRTDDPNAVRNVQDPYLVNLWVFYDGQKMEYVPNVPYGNERGHGTWHWPER